MKEELQAIAGLLDEANDAGMVALGLVQREPFNLLLALARAHEAQTLLDGAVSRLEMLRVKSRTRHDGGEKE